MDEMEKIAGQYLLAFELNALSHFTQIDEPTYAVDSSMIMSGIRYFGSWDHEEEDDDFADISDESAAVADSIAADFSKRFPAYKFSWTTGEKQWIFLTIKNNH